MCIKNGNQPSVSFSGMLFTSFRKESHRLGKIPPVFIFTAMFIFEFINELQVYATRTGFLGEFRGLNLSPQDAKPVLLQLSRTPPPPPPPRISSLSFLALSALVFLTPSSKTQETVQVDNDQYPPVHECLSLRRAQAYEHHSSTPRSFWPGEGAPSRPHPVSSLATNAVHSLPRWRKIN